MIRRRLQLSIVSGGVNRGQHGEQRRAEVELILGHGARWQERQHHEPGPFREKRVDVQRRPYSSVYRFQTGWREGQAAINFYTPWTRRYIPITLMAGIV